MTFAIDGVEPRCVYSEVDVRSGLPAFTIIGLGDASVHEARDRVRGAIANSGLEFPRKRVTANLAPASLRKSGPGFDVSIALAVLAASGVVPTTALEDVAAFGELSLGGELRATPGTLVAAEGTARCEVARLIVPRESAAEASLIGGIEVIAVETLTEAVEVLCGRRQPLPVPALRDLGRVRDRGVGPDLADVRGQAMAVSALQIAAAGAHNLLLEGPPGTGKTMLARRVSPILPPMSESEALEVTRIHSVAGLSRGGLVTDRPFRAPHHTISAAGLVGGGSSPRPGEASLAHRGVLFLDELSEFSRSTLDALRQPLEDGRVAIIRGQRVLVFPTDLMLVAATNPCPCGYAGEGDRCSCSEADLRRHRRRLSGPLVDRIDLLIDVGRPSELELEMAPTTTTAVAAERVAAARERQRYRLEGHRVRCNGEMDSATLKATVELEPDAQAALSDAYRAGELSLRGRHRALRVAQTIADLGERDRVSREDVLMALCFRQRSVERSLV